MSKPGGEAGRELLRTLERIHGAPPAPPAAVAPVRFQLMNTVAEHWIPFLPVHVPGSKREIQLQRGAMPRMLGNDPANFKPVEPRTSLLRPGLDQTPQSAVLRPRRGSAARRRAPNARVSAHALA